jgi:hypothetical protein
VRLTRVGLQTIPHEKAGRIGQGRTAIVRDDCGNAWRGRAGDLFGIESSGLTSCLAIADEVVAWLGLDESKEEE